MCRLEQNIYGKINHFSLLRISIVCANYLSPLCSDCSVCGKGYTPSHGFVCSKCPDNATGGIVLIAIMAIMLLLAFAAFFSYVFSEEMEDAGQGLVARVTHFIPLQSIKIIIVMWQILTRVNRREHSCLDQDGLSNLVPAMLEDGVRTPQNKSKGFVKPKDVSYKIYLPNESS